MLKTTQDAGVVSQTAGMTIIGHEFEKTLGDWLSEALEVPRNCVFSGWQLTRDRLPDAVDVVVYSIGAPETDHVRQSFEDSAEVVSYYGSVSIHVCIYGENSRLLSMLLKDVFTIEQNSEMLHSQCGLGFVSATIEAQTLEPVGSDYRQRADVRIDCNYSYTRTWSVRTLVESPQVTTKGEV